MIKDAITAHDSKLRKRIEGLKKPGKLKVIEAHNQRIDDSLKIIGLDE